MLWITMAIINFFVEDGEATFPARRELSSEFNATECVFPRPDGSYPPNPLCRDLASFITIPFVGAAFTYAHIWAALQMTFFPTTFWGIELWRLEDQPWGFFGWQGIIPTKAAKMARKSVRMMTEKLFDVNEIFKRVDPKVAVQRMKPGFSKVMNEVLNEQLDKTIPPSSRFASFAPTVKSQMLSWAEQEMPAFAEGFMAALIESLDDVFNLEHMVVTEFTEDRMLLNNVFLKVGSKELTFIVRLGFIFGFIFGCLTVPIWLFFPYLFILPLIGGVVGYITNDVALRMMFSPVDPHIVDFKCFKVNFQGVFLQRQQEASAVFAKIITSQVLNSRYMFHYMLNGPKRDAFRKLLVAHLDKYVDNVLGRSHTLVRTYMGEAEFLQMRKDIEDATFVHIEDIFGSLYTYTDQALDLENEVRTKMSSLSFLDFEQVLHPVFQEDEFKLKVLGGVLGVVIGFIQFTIP